MKYLNTLFLTIFLSACGGSGEGPEQPTGKLEVGITDTPVDEAEAVVIHYTKAIVKPGNGDPIEEDIVTVDPDDPTITTPGRSIDLLQFTSGNSTALFDSVLPTGQYSWIRLEVDLTQSYIQIDGQQYAMDCVSCGNNGLRFNRSFNIATDTTTAFVIDFDLRKSITETPTIIPPREFKLRPTVRVIDVVTAGSISGIVDPTLIATIDGANAVSDDCVVYVYEGNDAVPGDISEDPLGPGISAPLATAPVDPATREYTAAFLPAGDYTVSLTCDAETDNPLVTNDVDVMFTGTTNATVVAGGTTPVDFNP